MTAEAFPEAGYELQTLSFPTAERYIRQMHPEYAFFLDLEETAIREWEYAPDEARTMQRRMIEFVCVHWKKIDLERGLLIHIEDESCPDEGDAA